MFKSLLGVLEDTVKIVVSPVEIALDTTRLLTKPVGDAMEDASKEIKKAVEDLTQ